MHVDQNIEYLDDLRLLDLFDRTRMVIAEKKTEMLRQQVNAKILWGAPDSEVQQIPPGREKPAVRASPPAQIPSQGPFSSPYRFPKIGRQRIRREIPADKARKNGGDEHEGSEVPEMEMGVDHNG